MVTGLLLLAAVCMLTGTTCKGPRPSLALTGASHSTLLTRTHRPGILLSGPLVGTKDITAIPNEVTKDLFTG